MPRNGSGDYTLPVNSWNPATNGAPATAADWQALINDVATAVSASVAKDGQTAMTDNFNAGGNRVINLDPAISSTDAVNKSQLDLKLDASEVSAYGLDLIDSTDAAAARTTLGATATGGALFIAADAAAARTAIGATSTGSALITAADAPTAFTAIKQAGSETVSGVLEIATDAEAQAFTADKAIDGAKLNTALKGANQSLGANGYQKLPGGLIMQWGTAVSQSAGTGVPTASTNFPIAFPTACVSFVATPYGGGLTVSGDWMVAFTSTKYGARHRDTVHNYTYIALGY